MPQQLLDRDFAPHDSVRVIRKELADGVAQRKLSRLLELLDGDMRKELRYGSDLHSCVELHRSVALAICLAHGALIDDLPILRHSDCAGECVVRDLFVDKRINRGFHTHRLWRLGGRIAGRRQNSEQRREDQEERAKHSVLQKWYVLKTGCRLEV